MRRTFDDRFAEPRTTLSERFVWDYWHVPDQVQFDACGVCTCLEIMGKSSNVQPLACRRMKKENQASSMPDIR